MKKVNLMCCSLEEYHQSIIDAWKEFSDENYIERCCKEIYKNGKFFFEKEEILPQ